MLALQCGPTHFLLDVVNTKAEMQGILGLQVVGDRMLSTVTEKAENVCRMRRIRISVLT